jgi:hypothetical protein
MQWSDIPFRPSERTLRQFAGLWLLFFGFLAGWQSLFGEPALAAALAFLAVAVGALGLFKPYAVRSVFVGWMVLAFPIGWLVSRVLLASLYYGLFTPLAVVFRALGRDPLRRRAQPAVATYWAPKPAPASTRSYFHQY